MIDKYRRGQLGNGTIESSETEPVQVASLDGIFIQRVVAGGWHSLALSGKYNHL